MCGAELRELVYSKWSRTYDIRLRRRGSRMFLEVLWKHLEQASFPLTEEEYMEVLDAVAAYISEWGVGDEVRRGIQAASTRGPGITGGRAAKSIMISLGVEVGDSARSGEWSL